LNGTNCRVIFRKNKVVKHLKSDFLTFEEVQQFISHFIHYYFLLHKYINLPKITLHYHFIKKKGIYTIYTSDSYCGLNLIQLFEARRYDESLFLYKVTKELLYNIPNNVFIDAHPLNFTLFKDNVYYIDLIPPLTSLLPEETILINKFNIFKHISKQQLERRIWRYTSRTGRIDKYNYYLNKLLPAIHRT